MKKNDKLQTCPDCDKPVSREAAACPNCGHQFKSSGGVNLKDPVHVIGLLLCAGFALAVIIYLLSFAGQ